MAWLDYILGENRKENMNGNVKKEKTKINKAGRKREQGALYIGAIQQCVN